MIDAIKRFLIGKPLATHELKHEKFSISWGLAILSSDPISSVAYAAEAVLLVLVPVMGMMSFSWLTKISGAIVGLLIILVFSYIQVINAYPGGGGAYIVAKENIGTVAGLTAGAALSIDYILTVAVSTSASTEALYSAFPVLRDQRVFISLILLIILTIGNLRGIRESAKAFSLPTYLFIGSMYILIIAGLFKYFVLHQQPVAPANLPVLQTNITLFLFLRAFSSGCTALTGIEAVSNAIPNFKEPASKNAKTVLIMLAFFVLTIYGGSAVLANIYHVIPRLDKSVLAQIADTVFGGGIMFYIVQIMTAMILLLASNTAFNGFPVLSSIIARDGFFPRQFSMRGERLAYSNGIIILTVVAGLLIVAFKSDTQGLLHLYAVGVFLSFTLSQIGMTLHWFKTKEKGWRYKAVINGIGAVVTAVTVIIIGATKFIHGVWIVVLLIPVLVYIMIRIKRHYSMIADQLRISAEELKKIDINKKFKHHIIVPMASLNRSSVETLRYAKSLTDDVVAFHVAVDEETGKKISDRWDEWNPDIPLIIEYSPYRAILEPLVTFIDRARDATIPEDVITVLVPQFITPNWWEAILHNQTSFFIRERLLHREGIVISNFPYQIREEEEYPTIF